VVESSQNTLLGSLLGRSLLGESLLGSIISAANPIVYGIAKNGETLTTTNGTWDYTPISFTYQWQNNGVDIALATSQTYLTAYTDIGDSIRCVVTALSGEESNSANSNNISIVSQILGTNLAFWGIASDETSIESTSNSVFKWISANGNGVDSVQISGGIQPSTGITSENGLNTLFFENDNLYFPSALNYLPGGNSTIFVVVKATSQDSFLRRIIAFGNGTSPRLNIGYTESSNYLEFRSSSSGSGALSTSFTPSDLNIIRTQRDGSALTMSVNGSTPVSNNNGSDANDVDSVSIGGNSAGAGFSLVGEIAELIIYDTAITAGEISNIETYLSNKHNITI
jgi:hypothetical protein